MDIFHMSDIIPQIGLPYPPYGRSNYNVPCPCCDDEPHAKHLNINLQKDVFSICMHTIRGLPARRSMMR